METFKQQDYTINLCTDIYEWCKEFYDLPDDAEISNIDELTSQCWGMAQIEGKIIWIYAPKSFDLNDLVSTIAHEIGHIIEMEYPTNPEQQSNGLNDDLHELKADHYMNFYILVDKIVATATKLLFGGALDEDNNLWDTDEITSSIKVQKCRVCGCIDTDCSNCIEKTGERCYWVEPDLCSACVDEG